MWNEQTARLAFFLGTFLIVAVWETITPRRVLNDSKFRRWFTNLSLVLLNTAVVRFTLPILPVGLALMFQESGWGILNIVNLPEWLKLILAVRAIA